MRPIGKQYYEDKKRKRFVVFRTVRKRTTKTSVRYGAIRTRSQARLRAARLAFALKIWP